MLVELGVVEQRHKAVLEVLDGARITDVALLYGVSRKTVHKWLRRCAAEGLRGLADRPSRPDTCPHQMAPATEARVVDLRRAVRHEDHVLGVEWVVWQVERGRDGLAATSIDLDVDVRGAVDGDLVTGDLEGVCVVAGDDGLDVVAALDVSPLMTAWR